MSVLNLCNESLKVAEMFVFLCSCVSAGGDTSDKMNPRVVKSYQSQSFLTMLIWFLVRQ